MENWKFIENSDWQISDLGNAFAYVDKNNISHNVMVHRMVALYFCNPPENTQLNGICEGYNVHHKNIIKYDNRAENLVYLTIADHQKIHKELRKNKVTKKEPQEKTWRDFIFYNI